MNNINSFVDECMKLASLSEFDGLVYQLSQNKKETNIHLNNFIDTVKEDKIKQYVLNDTIIIQNSRCKAISKK